MSEPSQSRDAVIAHMVAKLQVVAEFLAQREEYIDTLRQCVNADSDYYRWQGHAESRRVLADRLSKVTYGE